VILTGLLCCAGFEGVVTDKYNRGVVATMVTIQYTVSDGNLVLVLNEAERGGFVITSPQGTELITEAETASVAFEKAQDAWKGP